MVLPTFLSIGIFPLALLALTGGPRLFDTLAGAFANEPDPKPALLNLPELYGRQTNGNDFLLHFEFVLKRAIHAPESDNSLTSSIFTTYLF